MKKLKIACLILGLLSCVWVYLYGIPQGGPNGLHQREYNETFSIIFTFLIFLPAGIICGIIAWHLNRSPVIYGLLSLVMPYILCFVMLFLKERQEEPVTITRTCGSCNKIVSEFARPGQKCPHCGVLWEIENNLTEKKQINKLMRLFRW